MASEFWIEVENAYTHAASLPEEERVLFLYQTYPARPDIRREVESLLKFKPAADRLSQSTLFDAAFNMFRDEEPDLIGSTVAGKYVIRQRLGVGNMGEVYLADHITLEVPFALKRPTPGSNSDPEYRRRLLEEARRAVILKHDNIARVHDIVESGSDVFVVMEYIEGETLRTRLRTLGRPMTSEEFLPVAIQCASALAAAHQKRIVHLDVKPENIMLTTAGQVKICDFGVARKLSIGNSPTSTAVSEAPWTFAGTPAYMAPEVVLSYQFDERADQFSLGIVFYEMLTGRSPFLAETVVATTARVVKDVPPPIRETNRGIDTKLERIVMRLLAKEPEERYENSERLVEEFKTIQRAQDRFRKLTRGMREAVSESVWMKSLAVVVLLMLFVMPAVWISRDRIEQWFHLSSLPERKVIVVLPIRTSGDATLSRSFIDGLTETVTATLGKAAIPPRLEVIPTSAVQSSRISTPELARADFGANLAIDITLQKSDGDLNVGVSLIETNTRARLRHKVVTGRFVDSILIQSRITEAAIALLEIESSKKEALLTRLTTNSEAYRAYLEGLGYMANRSQADSLEKAIAAFRQAISLDWSFSSAYASLGQAYQLQYSIELKDPQAQLLDRAREACAQSLQLKSNLPAGHICLGTIDNMAGQYQSAIEEFAAALQSEPNNDDAFRGLARSHERLNNWEAAEATYLQAIQARPSYWYSYQWLAQFYMFSRQQYGDAIELFRKAIDRAPENPEPYAGLCVAYIYSSQYDDAINTCKKSIDLKPSTQAYINLGAIYWDLRDYPAAAHAFEQATILNPRYYKPIGQLARAYSWIPEKRAEAPALYRKAIEIANEELRINPRNADVNVMIARYYAMLGQRTEAVSHLGTALNLRPKDAEYQLIAAVVYNQFAERDVALNYLDRAVTAGYSLRRISTERELDNLRNDPRFQISTNRNASKEARNESKKTKESNQN